MEQRSQEWKDAKMGKISGAEAYKLLTEPRSKKDKEAGLLSETTKSYLLKKIGELLTGQSNEFSTEATRWGEDNEPVAIEMYEFEHGVNVEKVGFIQLDEWSGCSPDGLVGEPGMIEVKCPYESSNYLSLITNDLKDNKQYYGQVQFNLMVTGREWCDFIAFDPRMPAGMNLYVERVYRDEEMIETLNEKVASASEWIYNEYQSIISKFNIPVQ